MNAHHCHTHRPGRIADGHEEVNVVRTHKLAMLNRRGDIVKVLKKLGVKFLKQRKEEEARISTRKTMECKTKMYELGGISEGRQRICNFTASCVACQIKYRLPCFRHCTH